MLENSSTLKVLELLSKYNKVNFHNGTRLTRPKYFFSRNLEIAKNKIEGLQKPFYSVSFKVCMLALA